MITTTFKIYRIIYLLLTSFVAFIWTIPLVERGFRVDRIILDDMFYVLLWVIGAVLLFQVNYRRYGFILTCVPLVMFFVVRLF